MSAAQQRKTTCARPVNDNLGARGSQKARVAQSRTEPSAIDAGLTMTAMNRAVSSANFADATAAA